MLRKRIDLDPIPGGSVFGFPPVMFTSQRAFVNKGFWDSAPKRCCPPKILVEKADFPLKPTVGLARLINILLWG